MGYRAVDKFTIMNEYNNEGDCPGRMIVDEEGYISHICQHCRNHVGLEKDLNNGASILTTSLASDFYSLLDKKQIDENVLKNIDHDNVDLLQNLNDHLLTSSARWTPDTERLIQQISLRYAHEILNALTPVYGILQILMNEQDKNPNDNSDLLKIAQQEVVKGKNYVNDFLNFNFDTPPQAVELPVHELMHYIETHLHEQSPEFTPYIVFEIEGDGSKNVFIDKKKLRLILQLILKKWIEFVEDMVGIKVIFTLEEDRFFVSVKSSVHQEGVLYHQDNELMFYLHLISRMMRRNGGRLKVRDGLTLEFYNSRDFAEQFM
ncbi:hypothetical protein QA612_04225 [Evansella sp. AB-P1]|uniref:hypothetical protein n=1 Tax=Evansella sp. AB-P1 TaxID=3037653 RepID=UPI00241D9799|nr:hypothetical protein [Evansella sp. AB-P1]MDG5786687.1 hypothetical protein [Evansella sp. AB-P1]